MARCLVRLVSLAVDKRDLHFPRRLIKHYNHRLSPRLNDVPNMAARTEMALKRR
jgi:hypothetical protein